MRTPTKNELLNVWENGTNQSLIEKSLRLLSVACAVPDVSVMANLSIGERDARLLKLREWMFGSQLGNMAQCPKCAETIEWETDISCFYLQTFDAATSSKTFDLTADGFDIRFRLPNSQDIAKATFDNAYQSHPNKLLAECILELKYDNKDFSVDDMPENILDLLNQRMAQEDPQANITMLLSCPACGYSWESPFDIMGYLWIEIDNWARNLLQEVYLLARAFGWSERDIIDMTAHRRQLYLEMLRS